jgi:hypothetical protein
MESCSSFINPSMSFNPQLPLEIFFSRSVDRESLEVRKVSCTEVLVVELRELLVLPEKIEDALLDIEGLDRYDADSLTGVSKS